MEITAIDPPIRVHNLPTNQPYMQWCVWCVRNIGTMAVGTQPPVQVKAGTTQALKTCTWSGGRQDTNA